MAAKNTNPQAPLTGRSEIEHKSSFARSNSNPLPYPLGNKHAKLIASYWVKSLEVAKAITRPLSPTAL